MFTLWLLYNDKKIFLDNKLSIPQSYCEFHIELCREY